MILEKKKKNGIIIENVDETREEKIVIIMWRSRSLSRRNVGGKM